MNKALALSTTINLEEQARILKYIKKHPSKEGKKAKNAYILSVIITLLIIFFVMIPLCIYNFKKIDNIANSKDFPIGATKEVSGHISLYEDTFWYTDSSNKYEFDLDEYTSDTTFENGEIITEFDKDAFEILVKQVIIGGYDEKDKADPKQVTFVLKNESKINYEDYLQTSNDIHEKKSTDERPHTLSVARCYI